MDQTFQIKHGTQQEGEINPASIGPVVRPMWENEPILISLQDLVFCDFQNNPNF